jgi:hypothetical protein
MSTVETTHHFVSEWKAINYYSRRLPAGSMRDAVKEVRQMIAEGAIVIGEPATAAGEHLQIIDNGTRYAVTPPKLIITATGGIGFQVSLQQFGETRSDLLGSMQFGSLSAEGQYQQDDNEVIEAARDVFDIDESIPAIVR